MPDFRELLKKPAGEAKKPEALPVAHYPGKIKNYELGDQNKNRTPYVRVNLAITGWTDEVEIEDEMKASTDLSKRSLRRDFFLTDDALWRLDEFLAGMGVDIAGRSYEEALPEIVGADVLIEVQQYLNQSTNEIGNQVGALRPLE